MYVTIRMNLVLCNRMEDDKPYPRVVSPTTLGASEVVSLDHLIGTA